MTINLRLPTTLDRIVAAGREPEGVSERESALRLAAGMANSRAAAEAALRSLHLPRVRLPLVWSVGAALWVAIWVWTGSLIWFVDALIWAWAAGYDMVKQKRRRDVLIRSALVWRALTLRALSGPAGCTVTLEFRVRTDEADQAQAAWS